MPATGGNTPKMKRWLQRGGILGPDAFPGILDKHGRPLLGVGSTGKGKSTRRGSVGGAKRRGGGSGSGSKVRGYTDRRGRRVRSYVRGTTQTTRQVRQHGLVWGGNVFHTRTDFSRSLRTHGTSINVFARRHRAAYRGLTTSFTRTRRRR